MRKYILTLFFMGAQVMLLGSIIVRPPVPISPTGNNSAPQVAVDPAGNATAIWVRGFPNQIETARFSMRMGTWSATIILDQGNSPQVAVDRDGNAIAVWINTASSQVTTSRSRFDVASFRWSTPIQISQTIVSVPLQIAQSGVNSLPQIAVSSTGNAIAVWVTSFPFQVQAACFTASNFTWSAPFEFTANSSTFPQVSMDSTDTGTVVWQNFTTGVIESAQVTVR